MDEAMSALGLLRGWLRRCPAIDPQRPFGADYLPETPGSCALIGLPATPRWRENIRGERRLAVRQSRDFRFAVRAGYGEDVRGNLDNWAFMQRVMSWISERCAEEDFPAWPDGEVTSVTTALIGAPSDFGAGNARYEIRIRVAYKVNGY